MGTTEPDCITIKELFVEDVPATGAVLVVTVRGSSFITGQTALKKAKEVAALAEALQGPDCQKNKSLSRRLRCKPAPVQFSRPHRQRTR